MSQKDDVKDAKGLSAKNGRNGAKSVTKNAKPNAWQRFAKGVAAIPLRIKKSVLNTIAELKKVTWPTRQGLINYSLVVIVFMVVMAILVGVLDIGASALVQQIIGL